MKVYFLLSQDEYEKLLQLADEVGDPDQVVLRAINALYDRMFDLSADLGRSEAIAGSKKDLKEVKELTEALRRLDEKISGMDVARANTAPPHSSPSVDADIPEIKEAEAASTATERPELDEMLGNVVITHARSEGE